MSTGIETASLAGSIPAQRAALLPTIAAAAIFPLDVLLSGMVAAGQGVCAICLYLGLTRAALDDHLVRLGLHTPHDRPIRTGGSRAWAINDVVRLIAWRVTGVHPETMGLRLDRSPSAVRAKARRLGLPRPPRKALRKFDPASLQDPLPGLGHEPTRSTGPVSACGRAAGSMRASSIAAAHDAGKDMPSPKAPGRSKRHPAGQREMPFFQVMVSPSGSPAGMPSTPVIPKTEADIDLSGDLTWIGTLSKPRTSRLAVWVVGMLIFGGLHYKQAAARIGKTPASFRTLRTRCGVPVDFDRSKINLSFDEDLARQTCADSGYILKQCHTTGHWFWEHKRNRGCNASPTIRRKSAFRDTLIEGRSPTFTLLTRTDLKAVTPPAFLPFAERQSNMSAR